MSRPSLTHCDVSTMCGIGVEEPLPASLGWYLDHALEGLKLPGDERAVRDRVVQPYRLEGLVGHRRQQVSLLHHVCTHPGFPPRTGTLPVLVRLLLLPDGDRLEARAAFS